MAKRGGDGDARRSEWGSERLDVAAYRTRIAHEGPLTPTIETLRALHPAHVATIPFENLDVVLGRSIPIDVESLQDKLLRRRRGGYCFEHNLLFAALLDRAGFAVTRLAGRVRMGGDSVRPRTHMLLRVEIDGESWLADVGFGGEGLLEPLPLADGATANQGSWTYRLERRPHDSAPPGAAESWVLRSLHRDGWFDLYSFTLEPQHQVDYVVHNHFISTHPDSPFVGRPVVQWYGAHVRKSLIGRCLTVRHGDGSRERRRFDTPVLPDVLGDEFGIELTPEERIRLSAPMVADRTTATPSADSANGASGAATSPERTLA